ncbi:MAG TPA: metallophosphoesterase [Bryobacteraceae bacterium]|nr:metallophosphoesterase [Bryobacteraceae bacterium]
MAIKKAATTSHSASSHSTGRYAHPFFTTTPPAQRKPVNGNLRMTDWSRHQLGSVPPVLRGGRMDLSEVIGDTGVTEIEDVGEIRFHALGDSGVGMANEAEQVGDEMATDYKAGAGGLNPAFLFHLGDVIYGPDKQAHYGDRFYRPYRHYPGKILAIPGNHDGEVRAAADSPSLSGFRANFCAATAAVPPAASGIGVYRETMTQPGVYWMLDAPFVRIIGLYSNLLENPGYLQGAGGDTSQVDWLGATLKAIAKIEDGKALVIATHHPPYSQSGHSGSTDMNKSITDACTAAGVMPHAVLSAHAHNYQRYTRRIGGQQVLYIVAGGGGMPPQSVAAASGQPADATQEVTYDAAMSSLGYLFVTVSASQLKTEFWPLGQQTTPFDPVTVDLATHSVG